MSDDESYGKEDINKVVTLFKKLFKISKTSQYDRFAAHRLINANGVELVIDVLNAFGSTLQKQDRYRPVLNSVSDLEKKWVSVINYISKQTYKEIDL